MLTFSCDGCKATLPTFIQPESEQHCLIGMNVIGITIRRKPLHAIAEREAQVRLVQMRRDGSLKHKWRVRVV